MRCHLRTVASETPARAAPVVIDASRFGGRLLSAGTACSANVGSLQTGHAKHDNKRDVGARRFCPGIPWVGGSTL
jgi:hypothetical protein